MDGDTDQIRLRPPAGVQLVGDDAFWAWDAGRLEVGVRRPYPLPF
jgi:hypothetical protein